MPPRTFPAPWSIEAIGAAFVVKDSGGQKLAYVYFEDEPGRRSGAKLRRDETRRELFEGRFSSLCLPISKSAS
jgi:hypothetical protein